MDVGISKGHVLLNYSRTALFSQWDTRLHVVLLAPPSTPSSLCAPACSFLTWLKKTKNSMEVLQLFMQTSWGLFVGLRQLQFGFLLKTKCVYRPEILLYAVNNILLYNIILHQCNVGLFCFSCAAWVFSILFFILFILQWGWLYTDSCYDAMNAFK